MNAINLKALLRQIRGREKRIFRLALEEKSIFDAPLKMSQSASFMV